MVAFSRGSGDIYHRYRPCKLSEVYGHKQVIKSLRQVALSKNIGTSYLFFGASGCGKTTMARILAMSLNCDNLSKKGDPCTQCPSCLSIMGGTNPDVQEINAAEARGIDEIRRIKDSMALSSLSAKNKIYILDECHSLTKDAQQSLLKVLEEAPKGVYIILCSTEPKKLLPTVTNRCQKFKFDLLPLDTVKSLLNDVVSDALSYMSEGWANLVAEGRVDEVVSLVAEKAAGSPRAALVYLQQILQVDIDHKTFIISDIESLLDEQTSDETQVIEVCRALISRKPWSSIVDIYKGVVVHPEVVRLTVLGYFKAILLKAENHNKAKLAADVMECFITPFYDTKPENSLVLALFKAREILSGHNKR